MSTQQAAFAYHTTPDYAPPTPDQQQVQTSAAKGSPESSPPQSRQAAEEARKDRTLAEFMAMLDDYEPLVRLYALHSCRTTN